MSSVGSARSSYGKGCYTACACRRVYSDSTLDLRHVASTASPTARLVQAEAACSRRHMLYTSISALTLSSGVGEAFAAEAESSVEVLATAALKAYSDNDLTRAREYFTRIVTKEPTNPVWLERRGQVLVDMKLFQEAIEDFNAAEAMYGEQSNGTYASLGLLSNRALAYEGLYRWKEAIDDYNQAIQLGSEVGYSIPYVLNSRGNCHASIAALFTAGNPEAQGPPPTSSSVAVSDEERESVLRRPCVQNAARKEWELARQDYRAATSVFQRSKNLPGAIFASSNAALVSAQLGDDTGALKELKAVARRAPGSIDMRAAIAAIYWAGGRQDKAEEYWNWACSKINSGQLVPGGPVLDSCDRYRDADWLRRIRRWPPVMVDRMEDFIALRPPVAPVDLPQTA
eukprot:jgi/Ulvmu1/1681/UM115_0010.1